MVRNMDELMIEGEASEFVLIDSNENAKPHSPTIGEMLAARTPR